MNKEEKEIFKRRINEMIWLMYEKNAPIRASGFFYDRGLGADVFPLIDEIRGLGIVDMGVMKEKITNRNKYSLTPTARAQIKFLPEKYKDDPYAYFLKIRRRFRSPLFDFLQKLKPTQKPATKNKSNVAAMIQNFGLWIISHIVQFIIAVAAAMLAAYLLVKFAIPH